MVERAACVGLGSLLPDLPVVSSDERKAVETADALGRDFFIDSRLREVSRPWIQDPNKFHADTRRYLAGDALAGWEPQSEALARFAEAADGIVVSHGTVMSLFVASRIRIDPVRFWSRLTFPDAWEVGGSERPLRKVSGAPGSELSG
ncbi:MAG TPA: hypothetical protein VNE62_03360 [Actinomycetota bacterium]|nr:hypothetical protein [Actinomycetota bacterium]